MQCRVEETKDEKPKEKTEETVRKNPTSRFVLHHSVAPAVLGLTVAQLRACSLAWASNFLPKYVKSEW